MTPTDRLKEIRERLERATPGPWVKHPAGLGGDMMANIRYPIIGSVAKSHNRTPYIDPENADFIAHAREDIPYLLGLIDEAIEAVHAKDDLLVCYRARRNVPEKLQKRLGRAADFLAKLRGETEHTEGEKK